MSDFEYPAKDFCVLDGLKVPAGDALELNAWQLTLPRYDRDGKQHLDYPIPEDLGPGFVVVVWQGEPLFEPQLPDSCQTSYLPKMFGQLPETGSAVRVEAGSSAEVVIIGIVGSKSVRFDPGAAKKIGSVRLDFPPAPVGVRAIFRILDLDSPDETVEANTWPRPAFVLTSVDGPRPVVVELDTETEVSLQESDGPFLEAAGVQANHGLKFESAPERPGYPRETLAIVCDFHADGDPVGIEGCTWRCPGIA
jgi:hypothetical protein